MTRLLKFGRGIRKLRGPQKNITEGGDGTYNDGIELTDMTWSRRIALFLPTAIPRAIILMAAMSNQDGSALLDALDEAEAHAEVNEQHEAAIMENYRDAIADRDRWKEQAEAMERALKETGGANCDTCKHGPKDENCHEKCALLGYLDWKFDAARFGGEW